MLDQFYMLDSIQDNAIRVSSSYCENNLVIDITLGCGNVHSSVHVNERKNPLLLEK